MAAWTGGPPDSMVTEVYLSPDNTQVAIVIDEGDRDIVLMNVEEEDTKSIASVPEDFRRIWP